MCFEEGEGFGVGGSWLVGWRYLVVLGGGFGRETGVDHVWTCPWSSVWAESCHVLSISSLQVCSHFSSMSGSTLFRAFNSLPELHHLQFHHFRPVASASCATVCRCHPGSRSWSWRSKPWAEWVWPCCGSSAPGRGNSCRCGEAEPAGNPRRDGSTEAQEGMRTHAGLFLREMGRTTESRQDVNLQSLFWLIAQADGCVSPPVPRHPPRDNSVAR